MSENKKNLSLADLGLDEASNPTPAASAEKKAEEEKEKNNADKIHEVSTTPTTDPNQPKVKSITADAPVDGPFKDENKDEKKKIIPKPSPSAGPTKYKAIGNVNDFLGRKPKKEDPIRNTLDTMYKITDDGIERAKKDLLDPVNGRIQEAKVKYIEYVYPQLMNRAKTDKRLQDKINKLNKFMDDDPRFDTATEIERKGYTIYVIAKKKDIGIDNSYFGIESDDNDIRPRLSSESNRTLDSIIKLQTDDEDYDFDEDYVSLGTNKGASITNPAPADNSTNTTTDNNRPDASKAKVNEDIRLDNETEISLVDDKDPDDGAKEEIEEEEEIMSDEQLQAIQKQYRAELVRELHLNRIDDLEGFVVETRPIELKTALKAKETVKTGYLWPLLHTGIALEMTPFQSDEIMTFNPNRTDFESVQGLNTVFSILYQHIINKNKPPFETWLRQVVDYDIDQIIFGGHAATFKDTNYLTYECSNPKCRKVFLQKKDIMDMVTFPNDEAKNRFNEILEKDTVMKNTYITKPKRISEDYAIGFTSQSIYSNLFEPASLSKEFTDKHASIINIMPNIDTVYKIDQYNRKLIPIRFGVDTSSLTKTVQKKVRALQAIFKTFTPDERAIVIGEARKIANNMSRWTLTYSIPETTCPHCGQKIEKRDTNPLDILFTRAQLPIVAAYLPE